MNNIIKNKLNCWEVMHCGREPGGANAFELGICPASTETRLNGIHGGENAGRACWVVAGSMCSGEIEGTYAEKYEDCSKCSFFMKVKSEENYGYKMTATLVLKLQELVELDSDQRSGNN